MRNLRLSGSLGSVYLAPSRDVLDLQPGGFIVVCAYLMLISFNRWTVRSVSATAMNDFKFGSAQSEISGGSLPSTVKACSFP